MKAALVLLFAALVAVASAWERSYTGYTIQRCPTDADEMKDLVYGIIHATQTDVMADMVGAVEILVTPKLHDVFTALHCKVVVADVQELIDLEQAELSVSRAAFQRNMNDSDAYHQTYHRYAEIVSKLQEIARLYPTVATYGTYGTSIEGRALPVIRIKGTSTGAKKTIYINGGIHAREWISPATNVYIIQRLAEQYGKDTEVTRLLNAIEFVFTPVSNPDGYEYTHTSDRLWRKNRNNNAGATCKGVDLNRNFDVYWGTGSSSSKCAEDYHGTSAASEPEVKAIQTLVTGLSNKIGAIDIHSYGQYIMRPYGWTTARHPDEATLKVLGDGIVTAIRAVNGVTYSSIRSAELYPVSGASDDWFTVELDLWGFCFELRDNGRYGFRLPEAQILPTGQEIFVAVLNYADFVLENFSK